MDGVPKIILLIETSRTCGREILLGIAKYSHLYGPWTIYRKPPFYRMPNGAKKAPLPIKNIHADGIITAETESMSELLAMNCPTISIDVKEQIPGIPNVVGDCETIGKLAAKHLIERGFRHFAFCGFDDIHWSRERANAFETSVSESGFETHHYKNTQHKTNRNWAKEQNLVSNWLKTLPLPIGLMACNDDCAQHVLQACKMAGLNVPCDIAVLGVDNDKLICNLTNPPLSSIALNFQRAGFEAAELMDQMMSGKKASKQLITIQTTHIVSRQSTDIMAIEDREVSEAVQFIRQHAKEDIHIQDVAAQIPLSQRTLERRFLKFIGHSINKEIIRTRINTIAQMLVETNMSVSKIAMSLGFPGYEHISRYFRKEMGMSLLEYRKKFGHK